MEKSVSGDGISEPFGQGIQTSLYCRGPDAETDRTKYEIPFGAVLSEEKARDLNFQQPPPPASAASENSLHFVERVCCL